MTKDGFVVMASEVGVLDIPPENIAHKGRLQPGRMFLVDTAQGRIIDDEEIKESLAARQPYREVARRAPGPTLEDLPPAAPETFPVEPTTTCSALQQAFGYTLEDLRILMAPMAVNGAGSRSARWATTRRWRCSPTGRSCSSTTSSSSSRR